MRTRLVLVGTLIAIIGGGLIVTLFFLSSGPTTTNQISIEIPALAPHSVSLEVISRSTATPASIGLSWSASAPANVSLTPAVVCSEPLGVCPDGPTVFNWTLGVSGKGTESTTSTSAYILEVANPGGTALRLTAVVSLIYHPGPPLPAWGWGLIVLGGVTLLAIGGIAVFLGLYLPSGVYRNPSAETMRTRPPPRTPGSDPPPP